MLSARQKMREMLFFPDRNQFDLSCSSIPVVVGLHSGLLVYWFAWEVIGKGKTFRKMQTI